MNLVKVLIPLFLSVNIHLNAQSRTIIGRVITEELEPLPGLDIETTKNILLGKTDMDGRFKISIPEETDSLFFRYIGMELTDIRLKENCDIVEVVMMYDAIYDFISSRRIDRLRKKRFNHLSNLHSEAVDKGLFESNNICYDRKFVPYKPDLDRISIEIKKFRRTNKKDFKELNIGDIVKIPFGLDTTEKIINTYYSSCESCTEEDYNFIIKGEIINKSRKRLTLEIRVTDMQHYDSLKYRGKTLHVGSAFKYEMKYYDVIID